MWMPFVRKIVTEYYIYDGASELDQTVAISSEDKKNGSPKKGDIIFRSIENPLNTWLEVPNYVSLKEASQNDYDLMQAKIDSDRVKEAEIVKEVVK